MTTVEICELDIAELDQVSGGMFGLGGMPDLGGFFIRQALAEELAGRAVGQIAGKTVSGGSAGAGPAGGGKGGAGPVPA